MPQKDAWADKDFADRWDGKNHFRDNPDREEQLDLIVSLLADGCGGDSLILDLGSGSGLPSVVLPCSCWPPDRSWRGRVWVCVQCSALLL